MDHVWVEALLSVGVGLGLAAAAGLRVFLPLLLLGSAARVGWIPLADGYEWLASGAGLSALGIATVLEIGGYYIPWIDNLLDLVAGPSAVVAGILATAAVATELPPAVRWAIAIIAGGGTAGIVQSLTTVARLKSSVLTGGLGNAGLATVEWVASLGASLVAIVFPAVAMLFVVGVFLIGRRMARRLFPPTPVAHTS
jgi:Domain of unknown function (DUF4126)